METSKVAARRLQTGELVHIALVVGYACIEHGFLLVHRQVGDLQVSLSSATQETTEVRIDLANTQRQLHSEKVRADLLTGVLTCGDRLWTSTSALGKSSFRALDRATLQSIC